MTYSEISRKSFVWSHVAAIVVHLLIAGLMFVGIYKKYTVLLYVLASILAVMSVGSLWPVLKNKKYKIN